APLLSVNPLIRLSSAALAVLARPPCRHYHGSLCVTRRKPFIMPLFGLLDRERTIAPPGFSRWLIPPAALSVHLCIGEIYGFSVFNQPLTRVLGVTQSIPGRDWTIPQVGWIYSIALIMLGLSAATLGRWVERVGPRKTIVASALCFGGGLGLSSVGVELHSLAILYLGYGVIGGIGLGLGYIAPVSTLVRWFPDRPG